MSRRFTVNVGTFFICIEALKYTDLYWIEFTVFGLLLIRVYSC